MKKSLIITSICLSITLNLQANNLDNHTNFRGVSNIEKNQENWYRELRMPSWIKYGANEKTIKKVLSRINSNEKLRDIDNSYKKTNWTYEFTQEAKSLYKKANTYNKLREVSTLFLIASYPNFQTNHEIQALKMSLESYKKAEELRNKKVNILNINGITALEHLPRNINTQLPVILWTGGIDKPLVSHIKSIEKYLEEGYAVITFDIPGAGLNINSKLSAGKEDIIHKNIYNYVKNNPIYNQNKVAALSSSGGGISLLEFSIKTPNLKAVVARCSLVDGVLTKPQLLPKLPLMTTQVFGTRIGANIKDFDSYAKYTIPLSLKTKGYFDNKSHMKTPLLVINTKKDPVAMPHDMEKTAKLSSNGIVQFVGEEGHCPNSKKAEQKIFNFITTYI